jgi:hypothetical protein
LEEVKNIKTFADNDIKAPAIAKGTKTLATSAGLE